jgi:predicted ATPase
MSTHPRVVVSGTYSTGKTTTATALSIATGVPLVRALSAREILADLYPGRQFQHMNAEELLALGLRRLEARIRAETMLSVGGSGFISDGSVLNEWAYAAVRARIGLNPGAPFLHQIAKAALTVPSLPFLKRYVAAYRTMASLHTRENYDHIVHLPVVFPMDPDGHRPVSERYRRLSDAGLRREFVGLGFQVHEVAGSVEARIDQIIDRLTLPRFCESDEAVAQARDEITRSRETVARRILTQAAPLTLPQRARIIFRF